MEQTDFKTLTHRMNKLVKMFLVVGVGAVNFGSINHNFRAEQLQPESIVEFENGVRSPDPKGGETS